MTEITIPPASSNRENCSESHAAVNIAGSSLILGLLVVGCMVSIAVAWYAVARADAAIMQAQVAERETRIMEADFGYVRAWLSARGYSIPANHEEAEEK